MIPSDALAVDGPSRTLTCDMVVPCSGGIVAGAVAGWGVEEGGGVRVGGNVEVTRKRVGVENAALEKFTPQLVVRIAMMSKGIMCFDLTLEL